MSADATIQAIVADQGNYLSADRGATWKQVPGQYSCASAAMSEDGSKIFLCCRPLSGTGVVALLSGDGGMTWGTDYWLDVVTDVLDCDSAAMSGDGTMAAFAGWGQNPYVVTFTPTYSTTTTTGTSTVTTVTATTVTTTTVSTVTATDTSTATATAASDATGNTTTTMAPVPSVLEVSFQLTVDDPTTITENETVKNAMVQGVASSLGVDPSLVTLEFQEVPSRRLARSLQASTLLAIFKVTLPSKQAAESAKASFDQLSLTEATADITSFLADAGYAGTVEVTGKTATVATTTTTTSTTTTSTTASTTTRLDAANVATSRVVSVALLAASLASIF
ncbi:unnamed protein product [Symbiodinium natans]|uniref:Uncharacterized protein n=1 Tax=Symbiodinium natans TaxID=878477 RepID=A0A812T020_9DINO|nr:unnamed protein product [Symbiodinium natans]